MPGLPVRRSVCVARTQVHCNITWNFMLSSHAGTGPGVHRALCCPNQPLTATDWAEICCFDYPMHALDLPRSYVAIRYVGFRRG
jgi:hypothetical protein